MVASTKKLEIHVSSSLSNKQKHSAFIKTKKFHILITLSCHMSCHRHHHNCRLIDCWFYKTLEIHVNRRFSIEKMCSRKQKLPCFDDTIKIAMIIGSVMAASTNSLQFKLATVFQVNRRNQHSDK